MSRSLPLPILVGLLLAGGSAGAQEAAPRQHQRQKESKPALSDEPALPAGEMRVRSESYEEVEKGHYEARGGVVDVRLADMRVQADKADVYEEPQPDGSVKRRLVAEGNVVFIRGEERLGGDRLEMDDTGHGFIENAVGYVEPGVYVEGRRLERVDSQTYRVEGGRFTSCSQPNPRWGFVSSSAKIEVDDKVVAKNAVFEVKGVPVFYAPYFYYPISRSGRTTGFLFPSVGYSSYRGFTLGTGFFWVMGRSADQTFHADYYSKLGFGFGHELRYMSDSPSRGTFRTYVFRLQEKDLVTDPTTGEIISGRAAATDYDIDWNALQVLPGDVRATLNVRKYSDLLFQQQFQESFNLASNRNERFSLSLEKDLRLAVLSAYAERTSTYFGTDYKRINGREPGLTLRRFPRQVGWGGIVFGLEADADRIQYGDATRVDHWNRYDVAPTVSRPLHLSFLDFTPSVGYRYTHYGASYGLDDEGQNAIVGPPLDRSYFETQVEMRGPTFSRVFDTPGLGYSSRFKHTIGPEVTWTYRSRVEDFNAIPKFDGDDYYLGTNQISYSLVQRFFAKRRGPHGKPQPYEFFNWRLMQTYYVQIADGQSNFDPNYSSSAFGPGFKPEHLSPLMSRMRLRPSPAFSVDYQVEYDVNFNQVRRSSVFATVNSPSLNFSAGWSRSVRLSEDPTQRTVGAQSLRGNLGWEILAKRLFLEGSADYDVLNHILWQMRNDVRYSTQCCGFRLEYIRYNWNGRDERQWRFNLELAGMSSIGSSFLGASQGQGMGGGYR
ncbi:MAG TPA: LPS assembly protein LptD [Vicinamibacteria bacterium]|nr:LPS assembly protein LptD [Vicinamibacteria bacterium]